MPCKYPCANVEDEPTKQHRPAQPASDVLRHASLRLREAPRTWRVFAGATMRPSAAGWILSLTLCRGPMPVGFFTVHFDSVRCSHNWFDLRIGVGGGGNVSDTLTPSAIKTRTTAPAR